MKINDSPVVFLGMSSISFHGSFLTDGFNGVGFLLAWIMSFPDLFNPNDNPFIIAIIDNPTPFISPDLFKILLISDYLHSS